MKRLLIIRHIRYFYHSWMVHRHYAFWLSLGQLPLNADSDYDALNQIWDGKR